MKTETLTGIDVYSRVSIGTEVRTTKPKDPVKNPPKDYCYGRFAGINFIVDKSVADSWHAGDLTQMTLTIDDSGDQDRVTLDSSITYEKAEKVINKEGNLYNTRKKYSLAAPVDAKADAETVA